MDIKPENVEPMEIDVSNTSVMSMDISYSNDSQDCCSKIISLPTLYSSDNADSISSSSSRSLRSSGVFSNTVQTKNSSSKRVVYIFSVLFTLSVSVYMYNYIDFRCVKDIDVRSLKNTLNQKVFGQTNAIEAIIAMLNVIDTKILIFYGETGVGKTLTASYLIQNICNYSNVYHYTMPSFTNKFTSEFLLGFTFCETSILVVDDLLVIDLEAKMKIKEIIEKSKHLGKYLTVILIYKCDNTNALEYKCDSTFERRLQDKFNDVNVLKKMIKFQKLTTENLKQCIEDELTGQEIHNLDMARLIKQFNVSLDGCKGVHSKIKLLTVL